MIVMNRYASQNSLSLSVCGRRTNIPGERTTAGFLACRQNQNTQFHLLKVKGRNAFIFIFASHHIMDQLLQKRICSLRSKFFPVRVDHISKRVALSKKANRKSEKMFPFVNLIENDGGTHTP